MGARRYRDLLQVGRATALPTARLVPTLGRPRGLPRLPRSRTPASSSFQKLVMDAAALKAALASIRYRLFIGDGVITVSAYKGRGRLRRRNPGRLREVPAGRGRGPPLQVQRIRADEPHRGRHSRSCCPPFSRNIRRARKLCRAKRKLPRPDDFGIHREIQFYVAYLAHMRPLKEAGLPFSFPETLPGARREQAFPAATIWRRPVSSSTRSKRSSPTIIFSMEPNGSSSSPDPTRGGKTTFARTFGQLHYLAALGCPVPAASARFFLFDRLFTHLR